MGPKFFPYAVLICSLFVSSSQAAVVEFPSKANQAPSPDRKFSVLNADRDEEPNHILSLQNEMSGRNFPLFQYRRHVDVSWSNDSDFFFVNDYAGSDLADCVVVNADNRKQRSMSVVLRDSILAFLKDFKGSHLYVTCAAWRADDKLKVTIIGRGDGAAQSLERSFSFDAKNGGVVR